MLLDRMKIDRRRTKKLHTETLQESSGIVEGPSSSHVIASSSPEKIFPPPLVFLPGNRTLVEVPGARSAQTTTHLLTLESTAVTEDDPFTIGFDAHHEETAIGTPIFISSRRIAIDPAISRHRRKRIRQCERWKTESDCTCGSTRKTLEVVCVYFQCLSTTKIDICSCRSAPLQLLDRGLFGCAPCLPTLAVDLNLLDFCAELFLHVPPNQTAFCNTLECFLRTRGYALESSDSLRKRFIKSLQWYRALRDAAKHHVDIVVSMSSLGDVHIPAADCETLENDEVAIPSSPCPPHGRRFALDHSVLAEPDELILDSEDVPVDTADDTEGQDAGADSICDDQQRPSSYLQARCPLCFGGKNWAHDASLTFDVAVCLDACFQQKRGQTDMGPSHRHPQTVFLDECAVKDMEQEVEAIRPARNKRPRDVSARDVDSTLLKVANEILDECESSFKAADERRQKASTRFFSDTGLMALLCRHDRVLWLVNMQSAGEKQYFALALLRALFDHLPADAIVGVLYDVGCQLHRSIVKWGFLPEFAARMVFAISVFHAFGHQWACQLIYHPRKCEAFGFTDGEGCERFWSSIKHLIPTLRVSGFYQRLHIIDSQVHFISKNNLCRLGTWLQNRTRQCYVRQHDAMKKLAECAIPEDELAAEWEKQVEEQTKALPRQSAAAGRNAVEDIVALQSRSDAIFQRIRALQRSLASEHVDTDETLSAIKSLESSYTRLCREVNTKKCALGLEDASHLAYFKDGPFINARMNAHAVKARLRSRLQKRKLELQSTDCPYRTQHSSSSTSDRKKAELIESQVRRHEPTIVQLAKKYNALCETLHKLAGEGKAPLGVICPDPVSIKGLFDLDVDDAIWQDVGLYDDDGSEIPRWLGDENVRKGIRALLELRRSREEFQRLEKERLAMKDWFVDMWAQTTAAFELSPIHSGIHYALDLRRQDLLALCVEWQSKTQSVPAGWLGAEIWGPSAAELKNYKAAELAMRCIPTECTVVARTPTIKHASRERDSDDELTDSDASDGDPQECDGEFLELAEAIEQDNAHAIPFDTGRFYDEGDCLPLLVDDFQVDGLGLSTPSPSKRTRIGEVIYSFGEHL